MCFIIGCLNRVLQTAASVLFLPFFSSNIKHIIKKQMSKINLQFLVLFWNLDGLPVLLPFCFRSRQVRIKVSDAAEYLLSGPSSDYWHATLPGHMTTHTGSLQDTQSHWEVFSRLKKCRDLNIWSGLPWIPPSTHRCVTWRTWFVCWINKVVQSEVIIQLTKVFMKWSRCRNMIITIHG